MRSSGNGRNDRRDRCRETLHMQMRPHSFPRAEPGGGETRALRLNASEKTHPATTAYHFLRAAQRFFSSNSERRERKKESLTKITRVVFVIHVFDCLILSDIRERKD
ncbi:hypothetical protein CDAR_266421 [Caerostris darwini]|uniref:Uncharacterized protein n=1 Tax=Caerostris darwini TaxID=1538125 RepID=A0AAV4Q7M6_9ARAC|nr:hypothetical protein CDAR_266421 [Caerostris darwini]